MTRVVVTDADVGPLLRDGDGIDLVRVALDDRALLEDELARADAYVGVHFDAGLARAVGPAFAFLQITAAGTDHVAVGDLPARVTVANAYGHGRSVAEHVLMVMIAARRGLLRRDAEMRRGRWRSRLHDPDCPTFSTLAGATVGIIGFGHIGRSIARLCDAIGMRTVALRGSARGRDATDPDAAWVGGADALDDLLREAAVVVVACPLTDRTRGLIGARELALLGPSGTLVNVGRGAVVDEAALYEALRDRTIAAAAIDVWTAPPGTVPALAGLDNVIMTPHYSATADDTYRDRAAQVAANILRVHRGEPPHHIVRQGEPAV
ncbi:2-hydroxyacid dehydrogenase [Actinomadura vinacea]|uniref:2-hydroxyacid dehydrogenase n=1 Tax=Actinomadura vinacea TaxID=115336 RepID=A0ABN3K6X1_9ACTN